MKTQLSGPVRARHPMALLAFALSACTGRLNVTDVPLDTVARGGADPGTGEPTSSGRPEDMAETVVTGGTGGTDDAGTEPPTTCHDEIQNGAETGVDCGGVGCSPCQPTPACSSAPDCASLRCVAGVCLDASCADGIQNRDETGIDCGGSSCSPCPEHVCDCAVSEALRPLACDRDLALNRDGGLPPLSSDAGDVVAFSLRFGDDPFYQAFSWTAAGGTQALLAPNREASVSAISADGQRILLDRRLSGAQALLVEVNGVIRETGLTSGALLSSEGVVVGVNALGAGTSNLVRWTVTGGLEVLALLPFEANTVGLSGVTPSGAVVVGWANWPPQPFRWSATDGLVLGFDTLPGTANGAIVTALSADGSSFVGTTYLDYDAVSFYRFDTTHGLTEVAPAAHTDQPGLVRPERVWLSADASVMAFTLGTDVNQGTFGAYRWTEASGPVALTPGIESTVVAMNRAGSAILGRSFASSLYPMFVWSPEHGSRTLGSTLEEAGVDLRGWVLGAASAISEDGKIVVGTGQCGGTRTPYRAVLPD